MSLRSILTVFVPHDKRASVLKGFTLRREEEGSFIYLSVSEYSVQPMFMYIIARNIDGY